VRGPEELDEIPHARRIRYAVIVRTEDAEKVVDLSSARSVEAAVRLRAMHDFGDPNL